MVLFFAVFCLNQMLDQCLDLNNFHELLKTIEKQKVELISGATKKAFAQSKVYSNIDLTGWVEIHIYCDCFSYFLNEN